MPAAAVVQVAKSSEVLRLLYLQDLSSGDFVPALEQFLSSSAGLSPATVTRLTQQWRLTTLPSWTATAPPDIVG